MDARVDAMVQRLVCLRDWLSRIHATPAIECSELFKGAQGMYGINTLSWSERGTLSSFLLSREECARLVTDPVEILVQEIQDDDDDARKRYIAGDEACLPVRERQRPKTDINGIMYCTLFSQYACSFSLDDAYGGLKAFAVWDGLTQRQLCALAPGRACTYVSEPGVAARERDVLPADMDLLERECGCLERWARKLHAQGAL